VLSQVVEGFDRVLVHDALVELHGRECDLIIRNSWVGRASNPVLLVELLVEDFQILFHLVHHVFEFIFVELNLTEDSE